MIYTSPTRASLGRGTYALRPQRDIAHGQRPSCDIRVPRAYIWVKAFYYRRFTMKLSYTVLSASDADPDYPETELNAHSPHTRGWQTPRFCQ